MRKRTGKNFEIEFNEKYFEGQFEGCKSHYYEEVFNDIMDYIDEEYGGDLDKLPDYFADFADILVSNDSITGEPSLSYTMNRQQAYDNIFCGNDDSASLMALLIDSVYGSEEGGELIIDNLKTANYEYLDVAIRCELVWTITNNIYDQLGMND